MNYAFLVFINIVLVTGAIIMLANVAKKIFGETTAGVVFIFSAVFIGLMPWITVPYSDTFGLFFTVLILYSYTNIKNRNFKACMVLFATIIGFNIKPTVIFAFLSILFVEVCLFASKHFTKRKVSETEKALAGHSKIYIKKVLQMCCCVCITGIVCFCFVAAAKNCGVQTNPDEEYTATHFLMLGLDEQGRGYYTLENLDVSDSAKTVEERQNANLQKVYSSLSNMGFSGTVNLLAEKTTTTFADGTFM